MRTSQVTFAVMLAVITMFCNEAMAQRAGRAKQVQPPVQETPRQAPPKNNGQLTAIGGLTAANMYTTYIAIGATADSFGNDVYTAEQVQSIMGSFVNMMDTVKKQLLTVQENLQSEDDIKYIDESIEIFGLLQEEARQLSKFAGSKSQDDYKAYEKARTTVWPRIKKLLGIKD